MIGPVLLAAQAVSMRARCAGLTPLEVDAMRVRAEELLPRGDQLRAAIVQFCTMFELRPDPAALAELGAELGRAVDRALRPAPIDQGRSDIYG
jgi:hypothetical protein